jgi:hypothetical protein
VFENVVCSNRATFGRVSRDYVAFISIGRMVGVVTRIDWNKYAVETG